MTIIAWSSGGGALAQQSTPDRIQETSAAMLRAAQTGDLDGAETAGHTLENLMLEGGFEALEDTSYKLIAVGEERLNQRQKEDAVRLLAMAEHLSPGSPRVLMRAVPLVKGLAGSRQAAAQFMRACGRIWRQPELVLRLGLSLLYPALWALTIGLYGAFVLYFICHIQEILRKSARFFPVTLRGFLTPLAVLAALGVPILFGPLWCLTAWAALFYVLVPGRRWIGLCTGLLLCLWAAVIPLRENLSSWLESEGIETMLRVSAGVFTDNADRRRLAQLAAERPDDGVVQYIYAQLLRKYEQFPESLKVFERAERLLGPQPYTRAERGLLAFLSGHDDQAERLMGEAESLGMDAAAFYLNYSKVKFERMQVASSNDYYQRALKADPELAKLYKARETQIGVRNVRSSADIQLPLRVMMQSLGRSSYAAGHRGREVAGILLPGFTPLTLAVLGGALLLLFFLISRRRDTTRLRSYYHEYQPSPIILLLVRIVPGGSWIIGQKPALTFLSLSASLLMLMPLVGWPAESRYVFGALSEFYGIYVAGVIVVMTALALIAYRSVEDERC